MPPQAVLLFSSHFSIFGGTMPEKIEAAQEQEQKWTSAARSRRRV
jgi:hypothetical protein